MFFGVKQANQISKKPDGLHKLSTKNSQENHSRTTVRLRSTGKPISMIAKSHRFKKNSADLAIDSSSSPLLASTLLITPCLNWHETTETTAWQRTRRFKKTSLTKGSLVSQRTSINEKSACRTTTQYLWRWAVEIAQWLLLKAPLKTNNSNINCKTRAYIVKSGIGYKLWKYMPITAGRRSGNVLKKSLKCNWKIPWHNLVFTFTAQLRVLHKVVFFSFTCIIQVFSQSYWIILLLLKIPRIL